MLYFTKIKKHFTDREGQYGRKNNVTEQLKELITVYGFNKNTLSQYLELPLNGVEDLSNGNIDFLPDDCSYRFKLFNKISFLYASATEDKDLKLTAFLQVLLSHHGLSKKRLLLWLVWKQKTLKNFYHTRLKKYLRKSNSK